MDELSHMIKTPVEKDKSADNITKKISQFSPDERVVFKSLEPYPVHIDDIARKISIEAGRLSSILLQLELKGLAQQSPGKFFSTTEEIE
jgi:DNA processing protein